MYYKNLCVKISLFFFQGTWAKLMIKLSGKGKKASVGLKTRSERMPGVGMFRAKSKQFLQNSTNTLIAGELQILIEVLFFGFAQKSPKKMCFSPKVSIKIKYFPVMFISYHFSSQLCKLVTICRKYKIVIYINMVFQARPLIPFHLLMFSINV